LIDKKVEESEDLFKEDDSDITQVGKVDKDL